MIDKQVEAKVDILLAPIEGMVPLITAEIKKQLLFLIKEEKEASYREGTEDIVRIMKKTDSFSKKVKGNTITIPDIDYWNCRFHPTDWWHEIGCPHMKWSQKEIEGALIKNINMTEWKKKSLEDSLFAIKTGKDHV